MQVEILGISLPWRSIFSNEDSGARFIEHINGYSKEINPFYSETDSNPFGAAITDTESKSFQLESSANPLVDLLTGEILPGSSSQPVTEAVPHEENDLLNFLGDTTPQPLSRQNNHLTNVSSQGPSDNASQQYIRSFKLLAGPHWVCQSL